LIRRLCELCKQPATVSRPALLQAGFKPADLEGDWVVYRAHGCAACRKGYSGRVGVHQVMPITDSIQRIILAGGSDLEIAAQAESEGVRSLRQSGLVKVKLGLTSLEEVLLGTSA
jgi:type IV pilus assembly protein PilB